MNLEQKIMGELKTAMLAKDEKTVRSLRAIKAAIILAKTSEGAGGEIKEEEEIKKILTELLRCHAVNATRIPSKYFNSRTGQTWHKRSRKRLK